MAFVTEFNNMLMEKASGEMLTQDYMKRDWLLNKIEWDKKWIAAADGTYNSIIVPIEKAKASNARMGKYTSTTGTYKIQNRQTVRGKESQVAHMTGSLIFNERDVQIHGNLNEQNLMTLLPKQLDDMVENMKYQTSQQILTGRIFAKVIDNTNVATGILVIDRPERFEIGQLVEIFQGTAFTTGLFRDNNGSNGTLGGALFVTKINVSDKTITLSASWGGAGANLTGVANGDGFQMHDAYYVQDNSFKNLRNILLPATAGGDATYLGITKAEIPFLQAYHSSTLGAAMTNINMLEKLFRFAVEAKTYQRGFRSNTFVMSLSRLGTVMQIVEAHKGMFNVVPGTNKTSEYGWTEMRIGNSEMLEFGFVGVQEMDDDVIFAIDDASMKFHTDKGIIKHKDMNGLEFFTTRTDDGYQYYCDYNLWGQLVVYEPFRNGVISGVTFTA